MIELQLNCLSKSTSEYKKGFYLSYSSPKSELLMFNKKKIKREEFELRAPNDSSGVNNDRCLKKQLLINFKLKLQF